MSILATKVLLKATNRQFENADNDTRQKALRPTKSQRLLA